MILSNTPSGLTRGAYVIPTGNGIPFSLFKSPSTYKVAFGVRGHPPASACSNVIPSVLCNQLMIRSCFCPSIWFNFKPIILAKAGLQRSITWSGFRIKIPSAAESSMASNRCFSRLICVYNWALCTAIAAWLAKFCNKAISFAEK